jgi:hypothetical protein
LAGDPRLYDVAFRKAPLLVPFLLFLTGCAHVATLTTIKADGSFHEKSTYNAGATGGLTAAFGGSANGAAPMPDMSVDKQFVLPKGPGVTVKKEMGKTGEVVTVERDITASDAPTPDVETLSDKGKPTMTSTVSVKKLPSGEIQLDEVLKWVGPASPLEDIQGDDLRVQVKAALPERLRTSTPVIDRVIKATTASVIHTIMGPPYPILFDLAGNPDGAALRLKGSLGPEIRRDLATAAPDLTSQELDDTVAKIMQSAGFDKMSEKSQAKAGMSANPGDKNSDTSGLTALLFEVGFPGTVVETNGLIDPVSNHVYWSLYAMSPCFGDVDLHLVVRP